MAIENTGGADVELIAGGKTSSGVKRGVYHIVVAEVGKGLSEGDAKAKPPKPKRPFIALTLNVTKKDKLNVSKHGKKLLTDKTYFACKEDDREKQEMMSGMVKRKLYDGFGITWSKDAKKVDERVFANKEAYVWVDFGKADDSGEARTQVQAVSADITKLPKKAKEWLEQAKAGTLPEGEEEAADAGEETPAPAAASRI